MAKANDPRHLNRKGPALPQRPTPIKSTFQFDLADIFAATTFSAVAAFMGIWSFRIAGAIPAEWYAGDASLQVALARLLAIASCSSIGGAAGTLLRNRFVGAVIGAFVGFSIFAHWVPN